MPRLTVPNEIINDTPADATPVEQNYSVIEQFINNDLINRDGSVSMTGPLHLAADPVNVRDAATKSYVDAVLPVGIMMPWAGFSAPAGNWHLCDGASLVGASYPELFAVLGYSYGGSGANFLLPNLAGRMMVGLNAAKTEFNAVGKAGGTYLAPVSQHSHTMPHTHESVHTHLMPHSHTVNPSTVTTSLAGYHGHGIDAYNSPTQLGTGRLARSAGGTATTFATDNEPHHQHTVDIPSTTTSSPTPGSTGASSETTTTQPSTPSTTNTGVAAAEHIPPYITVTFIIRIR